MDIFTISKISGKTVSVILNYLFKKNVNSNLESIKGNAIEERVKSAYERTIDICTYQFTKNGDMTEVIILQIFQDNKLLELIVKQLLNKEFSIQGIDLQGYGIDKVTQNQFISFLFLTLRNNLLQDIEIRQLFKDAETNWKTSEIYDVTRSILDINIGMNVKLDELKVDIKDVIREESKKSAIEDRKERIKPFLIVGFDEMSKSLYYPDKYSTINQITDIKNVDLLPLISNMFNMYIINTGQGNAKSIEITMAIKKEDALVTDKNLFWMSIKPLGNFDDNGDSFVQKEKIAYIKGNEGATILPINSKLNGILLCSIYNINHYIMIESETFESTKKYYEKKMEESPLLNPSIYINLKYNDLDDNKYQKTYKINMIGQYQMFGSHEQIKMEADFSGDFK